MDDGGPNVPDGRPFPPYRLSSSVGGAVGAEPGEDPRAGRIARRSPPGRVVFSGTAEPDVRYLPFATPSDVRTIARSGRRMRSSSSTRADFRPGTR